MGTYIAKKDGGNPVPNTPTDLTLLNSEISSLADQLRVVERLQSYRATLSFEGSRDAKFYLLELDSQKGEIKIIAFKAEQLQDAQEIYLATEEESADQPWKDVVLVSGGSLESLKRAYPNYFADTDVFIGIVTEAVMAGQDINYES
jgi:hypothetical protein